MVSFVIYILLSMLLARTQIICIAPFRSGEGVWKKSVIFLNILEFEKDVLDLSLQ